MSQAAGICELDNGSVAVSYISTTSSYCNIAIFNAGFTATVATVNPSGASGGTNMGASTYYALGQIPGGFICAGGTVYMQAWSNTGTALIGITNTSSTINNNGFRVFGPSPIAGQLLMYTYYQDGSGNVYVQVYNITFSTTALTITYGSTYALCAGNGSSYPSWSNPVFLSDGTVFVVFANGYGSLYYGYLTTLRRSIIGVSAAAAAAGASIVIDTQGSFTLGGGQSFTVPADTGPVVSWDHRAWAIRGNQGVVNGGYATLLGL